MGKATKDFPIVRKKPAENGRSSGSPKDTRSFGPDAELSHIFLNSYSDSFMLYFIEK
jgi:hypothetical protein